ncbi:trk system potassium uptake protein TrkA [Desulfotomaculum arcticum]|uniref:Trk system potassium uptake protein TrkA n=1 Tax=Desulfotruncus arcticus DSM 17038 TaxID=1121424 RepID=A0A1I2U5P2_9FIRM|nr:TrkA family potassium uptake protein [Desulfotruncus arcticus]SFG72485.1 trk system potassium uptake protein TrkA [Desulfotomaculum arcticum] [Desulfotruncus arcticus DSM 17038]
MKDKQFAVIGLGRFGTSLISELSRMGYDVLAIDNDENTVNAAIEIAAHAVQMDATDEQALKSIGIRNFDVVVVSIGEHIQASIMTTLILNELGVKKVVAKAQNTMHGKVLERIGARVIYPERDMAVKLARSMVSNNILDQIELSPDYSIMEMMAPNSFAGKSLVDIGVRNKLGVTVLAVRRGGDIIVAPTAAQLINEGDVLVALGKNEKLQRLIELE